MTKPCPFCGSKNVGLDYSGQPASSMFIKCHNCGAKGSPQFIGSASGITDLRETNNAAIQAWNQRSTWVSIQEELKDAQKKILRLEGGKPLSDCESQYQMLNAKNKNLQEENERLRQATKPFPMLAGIPITQAAAELVYEMYAALYGNKQSLEKIKSRGGFAWDEVKHITDNFIKRFGRQRYELLVKDGQCLKSY